MTHSFAVRVFYEDTDMAGIVYYANYLKFIERGRSEFLRALGIDQAALRRDLGIVLAVRRVEIDYRLPAVFDDWLTVDTVLRTIGGASVTLLQDVRRDDVMLARATVVVVAIDAAGRATRLPADLRAALGTGADPA